MTQIFDESGKVHPVTVIEAGPVWVTQLKNDEKDGYAAAVVGYQPTKASRVAKPQRQVEPEGPFAKLKEYRYEKNEDPEVAVGDKFSVDNFGVGDLVRISGLSKGKGFQGGVKRHGFKGGPRTHGQKHSERKPGSIGGMGIQRVLKGTRMAGRMGRDRITLKKRSILHIDAERNLIYIKGALPGRKGTVLEIRG